LDEHEVTSNVIEMIMGDKNAIQEIVGVTRSFIGPAQGLSTIYQQLLVAKIYQGGGMISVPTGPSISYPEYLN